MVYGLQASDLSAARLPDCSDSWDIVWSVTPGAPNGDGPGAPRPLDDPSLPPETGPDAVNITDRIYTSEEVLEFDITLSPEAIAALTVAPYVYVEGFLTFQGRTIGPIGVRLKGQNSFRPITGKAGFRLAISRVVDDLEFFGLSNLTFNNMIDDPTLMHDHMAYFASRMNGLAASRHGFAMVSVNGELYGLYSNLETVDRRMISRWFDPSGSLFETADAELTRAYVNNFLLEFGPDDRTLLLGLMDALALYEPGGRPTAEVLPIVGDYANLEQFCLYWAVCGFVGQYDSMPYNFPGDDHYVYGDPIEGQINFLPWGMDETFENRARRMDGVRGLLGRTCNADPACRQVFLDHLRAIADSSVEPMIEEFDRAVLLTAPYAAEDPRKPYGIDAIIVAQENMRGFIFYRRDEVNIQFPPPP